jgi:hypothetical protein
MRDDWGGTFTLEKDTTTHSGMMAGMWSGATIYPSSANRTSERFLMMVVHRGSQLTGFIKQRDPSKTGVDAWRHATLSGQFDAGSQHMTFTKTFDTGTSAGIDYVGNLTEDRNAVRDGSWTIGQSWTGGFQLEKSIAAK